MPSCEKCWSDSRGHDTHGNAYSRILEERKDNPCTPEQQAGEYAAECPRCRRRTIHQHARVCMVPGCTEPSKEPKP